jgi:transcriptional regulator with XRE-family HTH domain
MSRGNTSAQTNIVGQRLRMLRETLGWSQESVGAAIGIDESCSRARISRYELGVHEPPTSIARQLAHVLGVPLAYLYIEDDRVAALLLKLYQLPAADREKRLAQYIADLS